MQSLHLQTSQYHQGLTLAASNTDSIVLWNKYKLTIYDQVDSIFDTNTKPYVVKTEFAIEKVLLHNNNILCLDCSGNININTRTDPEFNISKDNVTACEMMNNEYVICLQIKENVTQLSIHEFNEKFLSEQVLTFDNPDNSTWKNASRAKNIIRVHKIESKDLDIQIRVTFDVKERHSDYYLVVICLDKINIYACIISKTQLSNLNIVKIYSSPSEIAGIHISTERELWLIVGLTSGNIVKVPLCYNETSVKHLNTALYKFVVIKDTIIYTDGLTMWKIEDIFSNSELKPEQFIVKNVRDFCVVGNKILCTTFLNLIYCFDINDRKCYVTPSDENEGQLRTDSNLDKIVSVTRQNEELLEKINKEKEYLLALSLSNRQSIMDSLIQITSDVFENYNDVEREIKDLTLTDNRIEYSDTQSYFFVIKISVTPIQHKLNKLLSGALGDIKIHITLLSNKVLKTTSIKINGQLRSKNFVIPLKKREITDRVMQVNVKIVTNIPGKMDEKQTQWTTLYSKNIEVKAENFKRSTNYTTSVCLREDDAPLETIICDIAKRLHGTQYTFDLLDRQDI